jgi:molybdenum-dependent DNA-binding transcriptional regulator ModE
MRQDLDSYTVFKKVVELGSMTAAARNLGIRKDSVGNRIKTMELDLGVELLHRTTRKLTLTAAGRLYLERYASAMEGLQAARLVVQGKEPSTPAVIPKPSPAVNAPRFDIVLRCVAENQWAATCRPLDFIVIGKTPSEALQQLGDAIATDEPPTPPDPS